MKTELEKRRRGIKMPHVYILLILVMALVVVLSWVVPSGEFARVQDPNTGQMVVDPNNFSYVEKLVNSLLPLPYISVCTIR